LKLLPVIEEHKDLMDLEPNHLQKIAVFVFRPWTIAIQRCSLNANATGDIKGAYKLTTRTDRTTTTYVHSDVNKLKNN